MKISEYINYFITRKYIMQIRQLTARRRRLTERLRLRFLLAERRRALRLRLRFLLAERRRALRERLRPLALLAARRRRRGLLGLLLLLLLREAERAAASACKYFQNKLILNTYMKYIDYIYSLSDSSLAITFATFL